MKTIVRLAALAAMTLPALPAHAQAGGGVQARHARAAAVPSQLSPAQRTAYRTLFAQLDASDWIGATARLSETDGPLHDVARAQLYTLPGSPRVEAEPVLALLGRAPDLPQGANLARIAQARGATAVPYVPAPQRLIWLGSQPRRARPDPVRAVSAAATLDARIQPLIVADQPAAAEALLIERSAELPADALTEFQQRVAWSYYLVGQDADAKRVAEMTRTGAGEWAVHGEWVAALAAWRLGDCAGAGAAFQSVARRTTDPELTAAGHYWAARADMACGQPARVQGHLRAAARVEETFYGLLAESALGLRAPPEGAPDVLTSAEWTMLAARPNVRAAVALTEIGQMNLAASLLRHQAQIGPPSEHGALCHLAARLNLPSVQMYLAHNGPPGARLSRHDRYPAPDWRPGSGWRVDQALAYAHALQESGFRPEAVSQAGARGLMQVRPGTAGDIQRWRNVPGDPTRLGDPINNLEFGQAYLRYLSEQPGTDGLLPRVIAAYNAGPAPIAAWTGRIMDRGDPLLYIESIPYWETRGYVPIVLRNYWMYEGEPADRSSSRRALAQGLWPRFPGLPGPTALRIAPNGVAVPGIP